MRVPDFKIQRAILDTQFERARRELDDSPAAEGLRATLEREYQLFTESINQWKELQSQRYEQKRNALEDALSEKRQQLQEKWDNAALRTRFRELEFSLKMQRKRVALLMEQVQLQAAQAA